jgi:hypothetical protein
VVIQLPETTKERLINLKSLSSDLDGTLVVGDSPVKDSLKLIENLGLMYLTVFLQLIHQEIFII